MYVVSCLLYVVKGHEMFRFQPIIAVKNRSHITGTNDTKLRKFLFDQTDRSAVSDPLSAEHKRLMSNFDLC